MKAHKSHLIWQLMILSFLLPVKASAQHSEIGFKIVLSGALMFGPCYTYWVDDHQALNASMLAAYEGSVIFPFAVNAGYSAHFFKNKWRPEIGLQYTYLLSPKRHKSADDPNGISILSLVPGVEYRWDHTYQNVTGEMWFAYFLDNRKREKFKMNLIGLDFSYGYKIH